MQKKQAWNADAFSAAVLNGIPDMVRLIDADGQVLFANRALTERFSDTTETKLPCTALRCGECVAKKCIREGKRFSTISRARGKVFSTQAAPVVFDGEVYALESFTDITKEQRLKDKLIETNTHMMKDLEVARSLQLSILRHQLPQIEGYRFCAEFCPCQALGGDMYDCFLGRDGRLFMYVADVSGHGVMPAMLTVYLRQEMFAQCKAEGITPHDVLRNIQDSFEDMRTDESIYITIFLIALEPETGEFTYANAGHSVSPLIAGRGGVRELFLPGTPVCRWMVPIGREEKHGVLEKGERLLLYTDGLDGLHSGNTTSRGLMELLADPGLRGPKLIEQIRKNYMRTLADDVTMVLCERE